MAVYDNGLAIGSERFGSDRAGGGPSSVFRLVGWGGKRVPKLTQNWPSYKTGGVESPSRRSAIHPVATAAWG